MSKKSTRSNSRRSTSSAAGSPANPPPTPGDEKEQMTTDGFGLNLSESFAQLDQHGSWLKMSQGYSQSTLDGHLARWSGTWPRSGIVSNGIAYRQPPSAPRTYEIESGSWPTPDVPHGGQGLPKDAVMVGKVMRRANGQKVQFKLKHAVELWRTPNAAVINAKNSIKLTGRKATDPQVGLADQVASSDLPDSSTPGTETRPHSRPKLNPSWVEWLMGFPAGWIDLERSEMLSSRRLSITSGGESSPTIYPTPTSNDARNWQAGPSQWDRHAVSLPVLVQQMDGHDAPDQEPEPKRTAPGRIQNQRTLF